MEEIEIIWQTPQPSRRGIHRSPKHDAFVKAGMSNPGCWFIISDTDHYTVLYKSLRGPKWERAYRKENIDGVDHYRIYVRYVPQ